MTAELRTDRLLLRPWEEADALAVRESLDVSDAHLRPWVPFMASEPRSLDETREWLGLRRTWFDAGENFCYAIMAEDTLVGEVLLLDRAGPEGLEIGYWIDVRHSGKGYATEAAAAMVASGFDQHGAKTLEMVCDERNTASQRVPLKLGFKHAETRAENGVQLWVFRLDVTTYRALPRPSVTPKA